MRDLHEEVGELLRHRLIQPEIGTHQRNGRLIRFGTGRETRRIAGQQMHEQEHQHGDDEKRRQQAKDTFDEEVQHETNPAMMRATNDLSEQYATVRPARL
jgi:hypothetical protein